MKPGASQDTASVVEGLNGVLLSVGCNCYDTLDHLGSAEADAEGIHAALTSGPSALYGPAAAAILRSPRRLRPTSEHCFSNPKVWILSRCTLPVTEPWWMARSTCVRLIHPSTPFQ